MANVTIQQTENEFSSNKSTWTFVVSGVNIVASGTTFVYTSPTITARYSGTSKGYASTVIEYLAPDALSVGDTEYAMPTSYKLMSWASGTTKTLTKVGANHSVTLNTSSYFNTANPNQRIINLSTSGTRFFADSGADKSADTRYNAFEAYLNINNYATLTLNAPPIIDSTHNTVSEISFNPSNYGIYTGITRATISIDNLSAQYGGTITNVTFKIGNQTTSRSDTGTLYIDLNASGTFTPEVIFTDSRGQTNTRYLNDITVLPYECSVSALSAVRVNSTTFVKEDEGTCAVLKATFTHTHFTGSTLLQPDVTIAGISTPNITWYQGWNESTGAFSNQVTNWTSLSGTVDLYGKITNTFVKTNSYTITVTPKTTLNTTGGGSLSTTLAQSFYLLVGRPGGHGLGIGMKPPTDDLHVDMNAYFYKDIFMAKMAGVIQMYAGTTAPTGWLICNGAAVSREIYATLFAVIGTTYGAGDGSTTFNLPDLRGRAPIGAGQGTGLTDRALGTQDIGSETHTLTEAQLPKITGSFILRHWASSTSNVIFSTSGKFTTTNVGSDANNVANNSSNPKNAQQVTYAFGGNGAHPNMQPSAVVNFIICTGKTN